MLQLLVKAMQLVQAAPLVEVGHLLLWLLSELEGHLVQLVATLELWLAQVTLASPLLSFPPFS